MPWLPTGPAPAAAWTVALQETTAEAPELPYRQRVVAIVLATIMLLAVIELVRQRKLREEYSALWVLTALGLLWLAIDYRILLLLTGLVGGVLPTSTLFFGGILFLMLLSLQFSVRLTRVTTRMRALTRRVALLEEKLARTEDGEGSDAEQDG
ncbi:MAG: DUF2304 domain-containing protein [Planctomycetota bacterium]